MTLNRLLLDVWADLQHPDIWWQIVTLCVCLLFAAGLSRWLRHGLKRYSSHAHSETLQAGAQGLHLLLLPLTAWLCVLAGRAILQHWHHVNLFHLVIPLLFSFGLIRLALYMLRRVFAHSQNVQLLASFERAIGALIWSAVALHILGLADPVLQWLDSMELPIGKHHLSVLMLLQGALSIIVTIVVALWLAATIETRVLDKSGLHNNFRVVLARVVRAFLIVLGLLVGLSLVGFDLTLLSVFGGALGVGLGLGLQKVASNYVSGFIVLLERSLRIGDFIEVNQFRGSVQDIKTRYTVLRALDGTEAIIPNENLVVNPVLNLTYTDKKVAINIRVVVGHQAEIETLLPKIAALPQGSPRVLEVPAPNAKIIQCNADGIEIELGCWITDPEHGTGEIRSELYRRLLELLRVEGVPWPNTKLR